VVYFTVYPQGRSRVPIKQVAGWIPELSWTFGRREISLASTGIQPPDGKSCSLFAVPTIPELTTSFGMHPLGGERRDSKH